jgi:hypothetical protein
VADKKEKWDSSDEKARELTVSMFGTPEEVWEMAKPIRTARNRAEVTQILQAIAKKGNLASKNGVSAKLTSRTISKIVSSDALISSFNKEAHYLAAANIDKLFSNAIEPWKFEFNPSKNNDELKERKYLFSVMEYKDRIVPIKFTVKEYKDPSIETKLYSIEAIDVELRQ